MSGEAKLDLLKGADQISDFMFGTTTERRQVYHLVDHHGLPVEAAKGGRGKACYPVELAEAVLPERDLRRRII